MSPINEYPTPPVKGENPDGDAQPVKVNSEGKIQTEDVTVEGLLYNINERLGELLELLKGII